MTSLVWKFATCNVRGMNNPAKQEDVICWHKDITNLVSIFMEFKLKGRAHFWLANRFNEVCMFTSSLDIEYLNTSVVIIMNSSLAKHVCKISEVSGQLLSIKLLFKNKLSVSILGLYAGAFSVVQFFQADEINSLVAKAVNEFSFVIFGSDFNKDSFCKHASFRECFDLGLTDSLCGCFFAMLPKVFGLFS
ncbi:hypothetical protein G9A89_013512 [Geosiphon pyriformis]|nr:hypothetical protein G9A89_013512 [Geosiphon pyriformis]